MNYTLVIAFIPDDEVGQVNLSEHAQHVGVKITSREMLYAPAEFAARIVTPSLTHLLEMTKPKTSARFVPPNVI